jgi:anion-transporting  ArsA/GET3 family ATPase
VESLLQRKLIVVTGKGGVGKTTVAGALGLLAAQRGLQTIVVEVGEQQHLPALLEHPQPPRPGELLALSEHLSSLSIDPDRVLADWLRALGGRMSARVLLSSSTFQYFVAAAPGARELLSLVRVWELAGGGGQAGRSANADLVILDAPATGHALGMLRSPRTFETIARVGPIAGQAREVGDLLRDPRRSGYLAVAQGTEMAVSETLQLREGLRQELGRELDGVVLNGAVAQRFTEHELRQLAGLRSERAAVRSAALAARAVHERARLQHNQAARLRRQGLPVLRVPFVFQARLDPAAMGTIAERLSRRL